MTLEEAQKQVDQWVKTYGVRYFSELTNMVVLTEEVGELARVMARKYGDQSFKEGEKDNIDEEIADVLWVLLCIANQTGVDITDAFRKSMEKKTSLLQYSSLLLAFTRKVYSPGGRLRKDTLCLSVYIHSL